MRRKHIKVMMNSIYGLFGSDGIFAFQDYRVAELVTALESAIGHPDMVEFSKSIRNSNRLAHGLI